MHYELSLWIKKILLLLATAIILYMLYTLSAIVLMLVIAGFLTILINPLADYGEKHRIPAGITVIGVYIIIFLLGSIVIGTLIPIIIDYVTDTAALVITWVNTSQDIYMKEWIAGFHFHPYIEKGIIFIFGENNIEHTLDIIKQNAGNIQSIVTTQISSLTSGGISIVSAVSGAVANWALIIVTTFLMVLERRHIGRFILDISPNNVDLYLKNHYNSIQHVCTAWIKATLILSISIFATTYIGLFLVEWIFDFTTERRFTLALIGWIMEFIPYIWPLIALIPAAIIGLGISWKVALIITLLYLVIQRVENDLLVPYVMSKALDLSPFLVFIVMIAGASLGGILGIILAVPVAWIARVMYIEYKRKKKLSEEVPQENSTVTPKKTPISSKKKREV